MEVCPEAVSTIWTCSFSMPPEQEDLLTRGNEFKSSGHIHAESINRAFLRFLNLESN